MIIVQMIEVIRENGRLGLLYVLALLFAIVLLWCCTRLRTAWLRCGTATARQKPRFLPRGNAII